MTWPGKSTHPTLMTLISMRKMKMTKNEKTKMIINTKKEKSENRSKSCCIEPSIKLQSNQEGIQKTHWKNPFSRQSRQENITLVNQLCILDNDFSLDRSSLDR